MCQPVSVIIPTYNRAAFLEKAIDSVLNQTYQQVELIVVDDGSEDGTEELVVSRDRHIVYIRQDNQGPASARNTGIKAASHDLIAFLDSDDRFDKNKLAIQVAAMQLQPHYKISHTQETWYRRGRLLNQKKKHEKSNGFIFEQSLKLCAVGMSTVMVRKNLFDSVGFFDEELVCCEDYDFWLRTSTRHPFLLIDKPLTLKNGGRPDQVSFQYRIGMDRYRIRSIRQLLSRNVLTGEQKQLAEAELSRKCRIYGVGCLKHGRPEEGEYYLDLARTYED